MTDDEKIDLSLFLSEYLNDAREGFQRANKALLLYEKDPALFDRLEEVARVFHTLKSSSAMLGFDDIAGLSHSSEDLLARIRSCNLPVAQETIDLLFEIIDLLEKLVKKRADKNFKADNSAYEGLIHKLNEKIAAQAAKPDAEPATQPSASDKINAPAALPSIEKIETVRVHTSLLDALFNLVGELMITKNRIDNILSNTENKALKETLSAMDHIIAALQENVSSARLVQVDEIFQKFPRMVRDLAREQNKQIDLVIEGREIELDKSVLNAISEPLIHLLRNAVGHGIESPLERESQNKPAQGNIRLTAKRAENHILIDVEDDGRGIDISSIKEAAVRKGFITQEEIEKAGDRDIINILFVSGFSSAEEVTGLSGRGVGLSVVKKAASEMGGTVEVDSEKAKGARFTLTLPISTAILQTLLVGVKDYIFLIPSNIVLETMQVEAVDIKTVGEKRVFVRGSEIIPFIALHESLGISAGAEKAYHVVLASIGSSLIGLGVDTILDQMDNIVKPFDPIAQQFRGFSGGTILGDGRVALLLDIPMLIGSKTAHEEAYSI